MKKLILALSFIMLLGIFILIFPQEPKQVECAWCFQGGCYSDWICGRDCFCLRANDYSAGKCFVKPKGGFYDSTDKRTGL